MRAEAVSADNILIREATHADLRAILDIYNDAVLHTTSSYDYEPRSLEHRTVWFDRHLEHDLPVFVAVDRTENPARVLGWSALNRYHDRMGYRFTVENSVYVAADRRGQGIGKRLMSPLIAAARERSLHAILAAIDASNEASVRLHAAFGFEPVGRFKEVGWKFGRWLDVLYMELLL
jgi:L-amino acid N-acyltransferase